MLILTLVGILALLIYRKVKIKYRYWAEKGVPYLKPVMFLGNVAPIVFRKRAFAELIEDMYKSHPDKRYLGIYQFLGPTLLLRDPQLIKQITVKDFDSFSDHGAFSTGDADPFFSKNLASMSSENGWYDMRATLSPFFTSSRMKTMFPLMQQCTDRFVTYFRTQNGTITIELKDTFTRFTNDVIGTTAFGVTCDSLKNRDNNFYLMARNSAGFPSLQALKLAGYSVMPFLMKLFKIKMIPEKSTTFFKKIIEETIRVRQQSKIVRPDLIHLLLEAKRRRSMKDYSNTTDSGFSTADINKRQQMEITDDDITAQALIFFLAGFDTASTLMSYIVYELALNPDIQDKLHSETIEIMKKCEGRITYEALLGMKYLDNVVSETLRRYPPGLTTDRKCLKPYTIDAENPGERPLHLDKGTVLWIPIWAIHMDPKYYPEPDRFDPDRFNDENKHNIKSCTYLPFGVGPRSCIGARFSLLETKLIVVELLRIFEMVPVDKTEIPLKLSKSNLIPLPDEGIWLGLKPR